MAVITSSANAFVGVATSITARSGRLTSVTVSGAVADWNPLALPVSVTSCAPSGLPSLIPLTMTLVETWPGGITTDGGNKTSPAGVLVSVTGNALVGGVFRVI